MLALALAASAAPAPRVLLLDAALAGPDHAIVAVGERGTLLHSANSGSDWTTIAAPQGISPTLTGVSFAPNSPKGWAVGHDATILASTDGGLSWEKQYQGDDLEASFLDVCALDEQRVIAIGAYGLCLITEDGGANWAVRTVIDDDAHLNRITHAADGVLFIAGERGTLLRSRDNGSSWDRLDSPYDGSFYGILPLADGSLLAYGLRGHVFRSVDRGETWQRLSVERPTLVATAAQTPQGAIVLAGQSRGLYLSRDGAQSFQPWPDELLPAIAELLAIDNDTVLAFGEAGVTPLELERVPPNALLAPPPPLNSAR